MSFLTTIFEVIDFRSFSNLWFWIALAAIWSMASHYVLGVPFDLVARAQRRGGEALQDLEDIARVNITRILEYGRAAGLFMAALGGFVFASLAVLAIGYGLEFAQALLLILAPMALLAILSFRTCLAIEAANPEIDELITWLKRHRLRVQLIGVISIFITSMWGMWVNLSGASWY